MTWSTLKRLTLGLDIIIVHRYLNCTYADTEVQQWKCILVHSEFCVHIKNGIWS